MRENVSLQKEIYQYELNRVIKERMTEKYKRKLNTERQRIKNQSEAFSKSLNI